MVQATIPVIDLKPGEINLELWLKSLTEKYHLKNLALLRQAGSLALVAGSDRATPNGESCIHQGLTMAEILAELQLDEETLAAAMIYSSVRYAGLNLEDITEHMGQRIAKLVKGTQQMDAINILQGENYHAHEPHTIDNIRKMLLAMVDDIGVVLIKLAERLCILRNVAIFNDVKKKQVAKETMVIYAPLANRLGIAQIKWQLEDLSFRYLQAEDYKTVSSFLSQRRLEREYFVQHIMDELNLLLKETGIENFNISGRAKHIYSIYKKAQRKDVPLSEIYDVTALRVLLPTIEDCYAALSSIHTRWQRVPKEFDDYIATPKPNGYRSIHTVIITPENRFVEIQIRTFQMHEEAELGVAAHWIYKEGPRKLSSYEEKIAWLRQVMDWQKEVAKTEAAKTEIQSELFDDRVYIFTPNGAVLDLAKGATPLDFAYQIHSELGHRCRGAKVNGHIVPLTYELNTGEKVEILTVKQGNPSRDWLNPHLGYLKTARARAKVLQWFKRQDFERHLVDGRELFEKEQKRLNLKPFDHDKIANKLNYKNWDDLLAALGRNELGMATLIHTIMPPAESAVSTVVPEIKTEAHKHKLSHILTDIEIQGVGNLLTHMANCCKPIPGDSIIGYVTLGKGVSIHRQDCTNILRHQKTNSERLISVSWGVKTQEKYAVDININAYDRHGLLKDITTLFANENISLLAMNTVTNKDNNTAHVTITIEIDSLAPLGKILARLQQIPNVYEVKRF